MLVAYALGLIRNWRAKELVSTYFFGAGTPGASKNSLQDIRGNGYQVSSGSCVREVGWHKAKGDKVVVVSASIDLWLADWCATCDGDLIAQIGNKRRSRDRQVPHKNCSGKEKAKRIAEQYDLKSFDYIYAYGDTPGDKAMLEIANEKYYKWKRI